LSGETDETKKDSQNIWPVGRELNQNFPTTKKECWLLHRDFGEVTVVIIRLPPEGLYHRHQYLQALRHITAPSGPKCPVF